MLDLEDALSARAGDDDVPARRRLAGADDGGGGPNVEFERLGVVLEPVAKLVYGLAEAGI